MKILFYCSGTENLGVEALCSYLRKDGHQIELLFNPLLGHNFYLNLPWLNRFVSDTSLIKKAQSFNPDLIAVSLLSNQFMHARLFLSNLKRTIKAPLIVGGVHASLLPEELIKESWVDMLCIGEGEEPLAELAQKLSTNQSFDHIKNLWVKKHDGTVIKNPVRPLIKDLDRLPVADKDIFYNYGVISKRLMVMTSRGCPHKCTYCINSYRDNIYEGQRYLRRKSVEHTIEELIFYKNKYKPKFIQFYDDVFTYDLDWLEAFSKQYAQKVCLDFECYITPSKTHEKSIQLLKASGCVSVIMGIQSGDENIRAKLLNRHYSNELAVEQAQLIKKYKIKLITEYIFGLPEDDYKSMMSSYELNDKLDANYTGSFIFYPFAKTQLTAYCLQNNYLSAQQYEKVKKGEGSMHALNLLIDNKDKELVYKFYAILPLYNKSNKLIKKFLIQQLFKKWGLRHKIINIISVPLLDFSYVFNKITSIPRILLKTKSYLSLRKYNK